MINSKIIKVLSMALVSVMLMVSFSAAAKPACAVGQNPTPWSQYVPLANGTKKEKKQDRKAWKKINRCKVKCKKTPEHALCPVASGN